MTRFSTEPEYRQVLVDMLSRHDLLVPPRLAGRDKHDYPLPLGLCNRQLLINTRPV